MRFSKLLVQISHWVRWVPVAVFAPSMAGLLALYSDVTAGPYRAEDVASQRYADGIIFVSDLSCWLVVPAASSFVASTRD